MQILAEEGNAVLMWSSDCLSSVCGSSIRHGTIHIQVGSPLLLSVVSGNDVL